MDKLHVYMWLHTASNKSTGGNKTRFFPSPFHVSIISRLTLAGSFRNDHVATCSTALRSATEKNELGGSFPIRPKRHSIVAQRIG